MPTYETARQRAARRTRDILARLGSELRTARVAAGLSTRRVGALAGASHTQIRRIEAGEAPHVDLGILVAMAVVVGHDLSARIFPSGPPLRDAAHLSLLARLRERIASTLDWATEVVVPIAGDLRSADATITGAAIRAMVEAETRLTDLQALERRVSAKARDLGIDRIILLVLDSRHNREVVRSEPELARRFPVRTRAALRALARGEDPGGDCLIVL